MAMALPAASARILRTAGVFLAVSLASPALAAEPLPALGADLPRTSVSGLSSGAYMAGQFQIAYSRDVIGAGIVAGGPYGCAATPGAAFIPFWPFALGLNTNRALNRCMQDGGWFGDVPAADLLAAEATSLADRDRIDPVAEVKTDKIYIFSGANDETVKRSVVERTLEFYEALGVPRGRITFVKHEKAAHAFVVEEGGVACGVAGEPFINDCDYDQAKAILETIHGQMKNGAVTPAGRYVTFDQVPFLTEGHAGMADEGVAYIPESCEQEAGCAVHVVFHGCKQAREKVGDSFITTSGFARWAAGNRLIVLFPQTRMTSANPNGCWDWWGYTGPRFLERTAPQMVAVRRMLEQLSRRD